MTLSMEQRLATFNTRGKFAWPFKSENTTLGSSLDASTHSKSKAAGVSKSKSANLDPSDGNIEVPTSSVLAKQGLIHTPTSKDSILLKCTYCDNCIHGNSWNNTLVSVGSQDSLPQSPIEAHFIDTPACTMAKIWATSLLVRTYCDRGEPIPPSIHPNNASMLAARLDTFNNDWPYQSSKGANKGLVPIKMAAAGLLYYPTSDSKDTVLCPYCDLSLDGWESGDSPTNEHKRRNTECPFFTVTPFDELIKPLDKVQSRSKTARVGVKTDTSMDSEPYKVKPTYKARSKESGSSSKKDNGSNSSISVASENTLLQGLVNTLASPGKPSRGKRTIASKPKSVNKANGLLLPSSPGSFVNEEDAVSDLQNTDEQETQEIKIKSKSYTTKEKEKEPEADLIEDTDDATQYRSKNTVADKSANKKRERKTKSKITVSKKVKPAVDEVESSEPLLVQDKNDKDIAELTDTTLNNAYIGANVTSEEKNNLTSIVVGRFDEAIRDIKIDRERIEPSDDSDFDTAAGHGKPKAKAVAAKRVRRDNPNVCIKTKIAVKDSDANTDEEIAVVSRLRPRVSNSMAQSESSMASPTSQSSEVDSEKYFEPAPKATAKKIKKDSAVLLRQKAVKKIADECMDLPLGEFLARMRDLSVSWAQETYSQQLELLALTLKLE
ncbi:hypothetical protein BATDEDRAFT_90453 [Batrachochytrium dendrobatidis JAM81]|uniref:BIR-domain-containing protein n=1 Tax=Batrachochytrium dendrobatidis (strain JAM81 / FGSC 10211) TaxID=684364 RepID=F4P8M7_BATDJ|nr:uncharacterized protein BATDEDRAFT_90453 [Batrachochytrium dendrobatidis JAM81]EGF78515.1 hypothetical protein BATDEDRAFT_90453 [Batrachochytrium dendrobatidis JAM81]|eukprot:XP_006680868.1 hypothetical protein BATDEDRAFT_90453 [Batrachochytrium dendrobatidis JAM81]